MPIIFLELVFVAVVALGIGFWQLWDVNRALREERDRESANAREEPHDDELD